MRKEIKKETKKLIAELFKNPDITKELLASKFRVHTNTIIRWQRGETIPSYAELKLLRQIYNGYKKGETK